MNFTDGKFHKVSIVVVNLDERLLRDTLDALKPSVKLTLEEVLVVDASGRALDDIRESYEWVRWLDCVQPPGHHMTIAYQRNIGVREAKGDVVVFADSGCLPEDNWLERLLAPILDDGEAASCGPAKPIEKNVISGVQSTGEEVSVDYVSLAAACNLAFRRQAFDAVGGFDESFDSAEDIDFTWRLSDCGYRIRLVSDAVVRHDRSTPKRRLRKAFSRGKGQCRLLRKHVHRIGEAATHGSAPIVYALFLLCLPLTLKWRRYLLLILWPAWRLRTEEAPWLELLDRVVMGAGVLYELVRPGTQHTNRRF